MSEPSTWTAAPPSLSLRTGEVHVWRMDLDQPDQALEKFRSTLEDDELQRAGRFYFDKHRRHFIAGRGLLRSLVGRYLGTKADAVRFSYGPYGKPALTGEHESSKLRFNMSHSHGVALFAVTENSELGVDVERIRADFASEDIARRFFSRFEVETFNSLHEAERVAAFFRCWTRKEAYIKATGRGLSQPLDGFDVTLAPDVPAALLRADEDDASRWSLNDIEVGGEYAGALIVEGSVPRISHWQWSAEE